MTNQEQPATQSGGRPTEPPVDRPLSELWKMLRETWDKTFLGYEERWGEPISSGTYPNDGDILITRILVAARAPAERALQGARDSEYRLAQMVNYERDRANAAESTIADLRERADGWEAAFDFRGEELTALREQVEGLRGVIESARREINIGGNPYPLLAAATRPVPVSPDETFWLVEKDERSRTGQHLWSMWHADDQVEWTPDVNLADQYEMQAEAGMAALRIYESKGLLCHATEHMFIAPAAPGDGAPTNEEK